MRIFVTGATGFVGWAVVKELLGAGHQVLGLARSDASVASLMTAGADVQRGDLDDLDSLTRGAQVCDAVIHTAFKHDFFRAPSPEEFAAGFIAAAETDRRAIEALGAVLAGSHRPLVTTSGTAGVAPGRLATEDDAAEPVGRGATEAVVLAMASQEIRSSVVRLSPSVHGEGDHHGFVPILINIARARGASGYVDDGANRWSAVHRLDAAVLFRLAVEKAPAGSRLHGVGDEGITLRDIATAIGTQLNLPVVSVPSANATEHFGPFARFASMDIPASSKLTRQRLGWNPTHRGLIDDIEQGVYLESAAR
ncbi:MAG TPA: SDR family oxidoreductase [Verrucomicrobiae bacterium]|nr:SDR family oxidoreductase [Verrucomicrobiae bacterium]